MFAKLILAFIALVGFVSAQLPVFPSNLVVFPERDFITVEGFNGLDGLTNYAGKQLALQVYRVINGVSTLIGEAVGTVSGADVAFEVNHPGGYCWGDGSTLKVTPDIQRGSLAANGVVTPGDTLILRSGTTIVAQTVVQNGIITDKTILNNVITVTGEVFGLADPTFIEARIVQPALTETAVGKRQVNAIPGGLVANPGVNSDLVITGTTWTATYEFVDANGAADALTASLAFAGAFSLSTWQASDAAGNAQGLTISEFGEAGGPMSALCPSYAGALYAIQPDGVAVNGGKIYWNAAADQPGATYPFNYYNVEVLRATAVAGVSALVGAARVPKGTNGYAFAGLTLNDVIEVRAAQFYSGVDQLTAARKKIFAPFTVASASAPQVVGVSGGAARTVTLTSSQGLQIAYTITTGNAATAVVLGSASTIIYVPGTAITITGTQTIQAIAFDTNTAISAATTVTVTNAFPAQVTGTAATLVGTSTGNVVRVSWGAFTGATGFKVYATAGTTKTLVATIASSTAVSADILSPPLSANVAYTFTVAAYNTVSGTQFTGPESAPSNAIVFVNTDTLTYTVRYRAGTELRVSGTGTVDGATITVYAGTTNTVLGTGAVTAGAYNVRVRPVVAGLTSITIKSSFGFSVTVRV